MPKRWCSLRQTVWLRLGDNTAIHWGAGEAQEQNYVARLRGVSPTIEHAQDALVQFRQVLQTRDLAGFRTWLPHAVRSTVPEVRGFARGLHQDQSAVEVAFAFEWNTGQLEGHVNRLKMLKRQTYGRANFDLLRRRVLYHVA